MALHPKCQSFQASQTKPALKGGQRAAGRFGYQTEMLSQFLILAAEEAADRIVMALKYFVPE